MCQAERLGNTLIDLLDKGAFGDLLDQQTESDVVGAAVGELSPGLKLSRFSQRHIEQIPRRIIVIPDLEDIRRLPHHRVGVLGQPGGVLKQLTHRDLRAINTLPLQQPRQIGIDGLIESDLALLHQLHDDHRNHGLGIRPNPYLAIKRRRLTSLHIPLPQRDTHRATRRISTSSQHARIADIHDRLHPGRQELLSSRRRRRPTDPEGRGRESDSHPCCERPYRSGAVTAS